MLAPLTVIACRSYAENPSGEVTLDSIIMSNAFDFRYRYNIHTEVYNLLQSVAYGPDFQGNVLRRGVDSTLRSPWTAPACYRHAQPHATGCSLVAFVAIEFCRVVA